MKKILLFIFLLISFSIHAEIDSSKVRQIIQSGCKEFCHILDINEDAVYSHKPEQMQFIIDVPVNYVHTELRGNDTASIFSSQSVKDSLNARIRRIYSEYGIELYIVVINSLDVIVNTSLPANATTKDFFIRKLYDEQTNIASVKALHDQITQSIISQSLSGHNRDCIIYSDAQYRGCFFADGKKGCWEYSVVSDHNGTERTYPKLGELQYLFSARLLNNFSAHSGGLSYMLPVVVDEFDEAAKYMQLKGLIQQSFTPQQLDAIFSGFDETTDYENLSESERIHALSVYTGYPMLGDWYIGTSQETNAIRIIEYTPADDVHELLYDLSQPNPLKNNPYYDGDKTDDALITKLIHHTDDGMMGLGDDNYAKLISVLVKLETSCKEEIDFRTPQDDAAWQNRNIEWKDGQAMAPIGTLDYDITQEDNGTVTVTRKIVSEWHKTGYNATSGEYTYDPVWSTDATFNLNPFDLVFFTNHSSVGMLDAVGAQHGQVFVAPAIMLKYAADKTFNQSSLETVALAFDALTLMTGPGAIFKALESGRMALAAFEATQFLGSTGNLVANTVADPDLQSLVDKYNMIVGVWGLSKIATNGVQFTVSYFSEAATGELHTIPASTAQDFENTFHQAGTKVDDLPAEMKERVTKMEEYLEEKVGVVSGIAVSASANFGKNFINTLEGFSDDIGTLSTNHNITLAEFKTLEEKPASLLTTSERSLVNGIRNDIPQLNSNTILQKVIPKQDISKYLSGQYTQVRGYMTTAADAKHLTTYEDIYYGMRLDYSGTSYSLTDGSCGVIRFKASNANTAYIPKSPVNGGTITDGFPFTGHGFTSGTNGRLGVPEWKMDGWATFEEEAELWEINSAGTEILRGRYDSELHRFVPVN